MFNVIKKHKEIILYYLYGNVAGIIYFVSRFATLHLTRSANFSVLIGHSLAIIFEFISNKFWVFSNAKKGNIFIQFFKFVVSRLLVVILDFFLTFLCIEKYSKFFISLFNIRKLNYKGSLLSKPIINSFLGTPQLFNTFIWTVFIQLLAAILNYLFSIMFVFQKKKASQFKIKK